MLHLSRATIPALTVLFFVASFRPDFAGLHARASRPRPARRQRQAQLVALMRMGLAATDQEIVLLHRTDLTFEASDRAIDWLARCAAESNPLQDGIPESIRRWVNGQRAQRRPDDAPAISNPLFVRLDDGSRLSIRHLVSGPGEEQDALLLHQQSTEPHPPDLLTLGLTKRESELLAAAATGMTNLDIAAQFSISERTVEKHFSHIYEKLRVSTRTAAVAVALRAA